MNTATAITTELRCSRFIGALVRLPQEDGVDAGALELVDLHLRDVEEVGDRELARRQVGEEVEHVLERLVLVARGENDQLRVEPFECGLELVLVLDPDDELDAGSELELVSGPTTLASAAESPDVRIGSALAARIASRLPSASKCLGAVGLGALCCFGPVDGDDQRDAVALGYGLAQTSRAGHAAQWYLSGLHWPPWHRAAAAARC